MEESFRQRFKEYFYFLKKDRNGIMVLIVLILLAVTGHFVVEEIDVQPRVDHSELIKIYEVWQKELKNESMPSTFFYFNPNTLSAEKMDSLSIPLFIKRNIISYRSAGGSFTEASDLRKIYGMNDSIFSIIEPWLVFPEKGVKMEKRIKVKEAPKPEGYFDPNTSAADELYRFGFNRFQVSNIEKYRERGGKFKKPEDVLKIYGVDSAFYGLIHNHIRIPDMTAASDEIITSEVPIIELNEADSLDLVQLKGIGPVFASRILKYRSLLGGYYSVNQLLEVYGFPENTFLEIKKYVDTDSTKVKKLRLNFAEYSDLLRHPYLEKEQVVAILNFRQKNGPFNNEEQLLNRGLIDSITYRNMKPYLSCR